MAFLASRWWEDVRDPILPVTRMIDRVLPEPNNQRNHAGGIWRDWRRRNRLTIGALVALLVLAAFLGEVAPDGVGLTSAARPYNLFHLLAGVLGLGVLVFGGPRAVAAFNLGFGVVDLYQALAGVLGLAPAQVFGLRPADHVIHVVLGAALVAVAWPWPAQASVIHPSSSGHKPV